MSAEPDSAARRWRRIAGIALALIALDLAFVVITGDLSFLTPWLKVAAFGFALREVALAALIILRFRVLADPERRLSAGHIAMILATIPSLFHLQMIGRRITGDALYYYVYTRSMMRDGDVNFTNEFAHYQLLSRYDFSQPTDTGHRRTIYSVGPGLLWTPFFVVGDVVGTGFQATGRDVNMTGYGPLHLNAVALGSFAYGIAGLFLIHAFLRRHFDDALSAGTVILLWWASFMPWYLAEQPMTSHPASIFLAALFFVLRQRGALGSATGSLASGLCIGLAMSVRWQNGVFLLLPAVDWFLEWRRGASLGSVVKRGALFASMVFLGALPQMLAWKAIFGEYLLRYPPQGTDFLRLSRPFFVNVLFSSRHGLFSWTPVFLLCFAGLGLLTRQNPRRFGILWAPVLIMTYVNACVGDWWAGGAYSNRRFDSLLPIFAMGLAAFVAAAIDALRRRPMLPVAALVIASISWNFWFAVTARENEALRTQPASFAARALATTETLSNRIGFPTTWPASWLFAWRLNASPGRFDLASGQYLFYRQNNLEGLVDLGEPGDDGSILDGFSDPRRGAFTFRTMESPGRLVVSLDVAESLGVVVRARTRLDQAVPITVEVNGVVVGTVAAANDWTDGRVEAPVGVWRRGTNVVSLKAPSEIDVDSVKFIEAAR